MEALDTEKLFARLDVGLELASEIRKQIYSDLHYDKIMPLLKEISLLNRNRNTYSEENIRSNILVDEDLFADLYKNFVKAKQRLHYDEDIELYVDGKSKNNAFSLIDDGRTNVVGLGAEIFT